MDNAVLFEEKKEEKEEKEKKEEKEEKEEKKEEKKKGKVAWPVAPMLPQSIRQAANDAARSRKRLAPAVQRLSLGTNPAAPVHAPVEVLLCDTNCLRRELREVLQTLLPRYLTY